MNNHIHWSCLAFFMLAYLPFSNQHSMTLNLAVGAIAILSVVINRKSYRIKRWMTGSLIILGMVLIYAQHGTFKGLEPGVGILAILGILKTTELREKRDFTIFLLIIELLLVGHLLTVDSLAMLFYTILISFCLFLLLLAFHRNSEGWRTLDRTRMKIYYQIFALSLPLSLAMFFLFPRLYVGNLFLNSVKNQTKIGFTEEVKPGDFAKVVSDKTPLFRAHFQKGHEPDYFDFYWRGAVLGETDGFHWTRGKLGKISQVEPDSDSKEKVYTVDFDHLQLSNIFLLDGTTNINKLSRGHLFREAGETFKFLPYSNQKIRYEGIRKKYSWRSLNAGERLKYLKVPENLSERVKNFARSFSTEFPEKNRLIEEFLKRFRNEKFFYTLNPGEISGEDKLGSFFFDVKKGYCEHYASATAIFMRLFGIPSRMVVGFQGGLYNPLGDYYIIRGQDAHAWVEVWIEGAGWKRIDPTYSVAPERIRYGAESWMLGALRPEGTRMEDFIDLQNQGFLKRALFAWDMFYYEINRKFIGFDYDAQKNMFKSWRLGKLLAFKLGLIMLVSFFFVVGLLTGWLKWKDGRKSQLDRAYDLLCQKLEKQGLTRKPWEGPISFRQRIHTKFGKNETIDGVISDYIAMKYGHSSSDAGNLLKIVKKLDLNSHSHTDRP